MSSVVRGIRGIFLEPGQSFSVMFFSLFLIVKKGVEFKSELRQNGSDREKGEKADFNMAAMYSCNFEKIREFM